MHCFRNSLSQGLLLFSAVVFCLAPVSLYYGTSHDFRVKNDFEIRSVTSGSGIDVSIRPQHKIKQLPAKLFTLSDALRDVRWAVSGEYSTENVSYPHRTVLIAQYFRAPPLFHLF